jgi:hypothetical protein
MAVIGRCFKIDAYQASRASCSCTRNKMKKENGKAKVLNKTEFNRVNLHHFKVTQKSFPMRRSSDRG